jgi:His-Xaa-Ser system protein HxsD
MERSQFIIDRALYSDDVAARAVHRYTGELGVEVRSQGANLIVGFWSLDGSNLSEDIWTRFSRDLLDERLRAAVRSETNGLQQELLHAALNEAQPVVPHVEV